MGRRNFTAECDRPRPTSAASSRKNIPSTNFPYQFVAYSELALAAQFRDTSANAFQKGDTEIFSQLCVNSRTMRATLYPSLHARNYH